MTEPPSKSPQPEVNGNETKELKQWLMKSNCSQHYSKFVDNGISFDLVPELDTESLKEIGITKVGDRLKLEIAITSMKAQNLKKVISIDELYKNLNLLKLTSPLDSSSDATLIQSKVPNTSSNTLNLSANMLGDTKTANKNITFILADGSLKKVNVTGCFNAQSIKRKVLRKLGIKQQETLYDTYVHNGSDSIALLYDVELVTICYSPERLEKHRIILCEKDQYPTDIAMEISKKIMSKYEKFNRQKQKLNQYHLPERPQISNMRQFFGQRPPSELISSNLAEYFPEAYQKDLEASIRNSVRYSARLSKRFQGLAPIGSNQSVRRMSNATMKHHSPSISSGEFNIRSQRRVPAGITIGDMMMNHASAIEEVVNPVYPDNLSIFSKPSINSDGTSTNVNELGPSTSNNSKNPRVSISASFVDQGNENNRHSRIELLNVDSDEDEYGDYDEDLISEYGDETNDLFDVVSVDGPKNWLKGARIGSGSFGTVYLGMSPFTGELMAVKQVSLAENSESQKSMIEALQHEMLLLKNMNHENIVRYLGSSISDDFLNIFLEYVPGGSVQTMLFSYGPFEEPLIRNFIRQVLIGLSYLHGEDIIHRDIKGANILIDIKGTVKISDFGISKKISKNKEDEEIVEDKEKPSRRASLQGSVYWMAPEVVKQTAYTKKADIWSVGCLIVEMFTGKHPFPNFSQMQAIFKIGTHVSPSIPEWCTAEAKEFLEKTFELEYEKRPDAVDLLSESFMNPLIMSKQ